MEERKCAAGCKHFTGGEVHHHKDCVFYKGSLSEELDLHRIPSATDLDELKSLAEKLSETDKQAIVEGAVSAASKVLMSASILTNSNNFIRSTLEFPDGSTWVLDFRKRQS